MALKSNFEATNVISSPFVDEIANPGSERTTFAMALRAAQAGGAPAEPLPVTGEPATEVVNAASPAQLKKQGASLAAQVERSRQLSAKAKKE